MTERKNHEIRIKVSAEELETIKRKAEKVGVPVSSFLRTLGLISTITPTNIL